MLPSVGTSSTGTTGAHMWGRQGTSAQPAGGVAFPEDVEALERVIAALGADVSDEIVVHQRILHSLVDSLDLVYGAAWLPDPSGDFVLRVAEGELAPTMTAAWTDGTAMVSGAGYGGQALR